MKTQLLILLLGLLGAVNTSGQESNTQNVKEIMNQSIDDAISLEKVSEVNAISTNVFMVYGNCGMCEKTIEDSLQGVVGVTKGDWDKETDMIEVDFDSNKISLDEIKQRIADVGYDTETHRATDEVYDNLPGCCQYDRPEKK